MEIYMELFSFIALLTITTYVYAYVDTKKQIKEEEIKIKNNKINSIEYAQPTLKVLTQEQIDDIHARGKITPEEKVREWEDIGLCAPGDAIGSAALRCRKFGNCHDCLIDYANEHDEYTSFKDILKICRPYNIKGDTDNK